MKRLLGRPLLFALLLPMLAPSGLLAEQRYAVRGMVVRVNQSARTFTASIDAIPNYMRAMTMPFEVRAAADLDRLAPGAIVEFTLVVGDGSSLYGIQALWSAAHYRVGVLFVVLSNGGYAIMDRLAERRGLEAPWPRFDEIDIAALARGFGCPGRRIQTYDELVSALDEVLPTLASRSEPLLLDIVIAPTETFAP